MKPIDAELGGSPGSTISLDDLYRQYSEEVRCYVRRTYGFGPPSPDEVTQQTFAKLAASKTVPTIRNPKAFLFQAARNVVIDAHRKAATRRRLLEINGPDLQEKCDDLHPERVLSAKERLAVVKETIETMPTQRQRSFLLHRLQGLSYAEIARQTGYSESGVKKHVAIALDEIECAVSAAETLPASRMDEGQ